jgi:hypothetical protein
MPRKKRSPPLPNEDRRLVLRGADKEAFLKAVANPPPPTARLIAEFKRHAQLTAKDQGQGQIQRRDNKKY